MASKSLPIVSPAIGGLNVRMLALFGGIVLLGVLLRINNLAGLRAFWADELLVIGNAMTRSYAELATPLTGDQVAPYGFLVLLKWFGETFGYSEAVLRLPLFLAGIGSLLLFARLAVKYTTPAVAGLAVFLFATCDWLIFYSAEAKQYGLDPLAAIVLSLAALSVRSQWTWPRLATLAVLGAGMVWISHPSAFVIAAIGGVFFLQELSAGRKHRALLILALSVPALASFVLHLVVTATMTSETVVNFREVGWTSAFMPFPPLSISDVQWYPTYLLRIFGTPVGFRLEGLGAALALIGCWSVYQRDKFFLGLLLFPLIIALAVSALSLYPFTGRYLLFSVPALLILIAAGLVTIVQTTWHGARVVAVGIVGIALFYPFASTTKQAVAEIPYAREHLPSALTFVSQNFRPGDEIYLYYAARIGFDFYAARYGLDDAPLIFGQPPRGDWPAYLQDVQRLRCRGRVWVIFSHTREPDEEILLSFLDQEGSRLESFPVRQESPLYPSLSGAAVYLYDFGPLTLSDCG